MAFDLLIVGGGINGCAIARAAAYAGLSVLLVERDDLGSHTSSSSTKLIHGGLRYLEHREFALVREALKERERLLRAAPHLITPMAFVLPHENAVRPWWLVRAGLLLYDALGGLISLPRSRALRRSDTAYLAPLKRRSRGFVYSDAWVDDARFVVLNAMDAHAHGAEIATRTALIAAERTDGLWRATLSDGRRVEARMLVNAAGPWVAQALSLTGARARAGVRLVKGSHIVVPRLFEGHHAYMLQQPDRRIVFAIAYDGDTTLVGTTDVPVERPEDAAINDAEIAYLCDATNRYFTRQVSAADVVHSYSGVRPLYDDGTSDASQVTRDYVLEVEREGPPLLSVFGGKITTARHLAEEVLERLGHASRATRTALFPGGEVGEFKDFLATVATRCPQLAGAQVERMAHAYGSMLPELLGDGDLGEDFGGGLSAREVDWLLAREWARTADDILWRRTKLGLVIDADGRARLERYLERHHAPAAGT